MTWLQTRQRNSPLLPGLVANSIRRYPARHCGQVVSDFLMAVRIPLRPRQSTGSLPLVGTTSEKAVDTHFVHSSSRQLTVRGASFLGHPQLIHRFSTGGLSRNGGHSHAQCMDLVADRGSDLHYYRRVDGERGHLAGGRCRIGFRQRTTPPPDLPYLLRAPRSSTHRPATAVATPLPKADFGRFVPI